MNTAPGGWLNPANWGALIGQAGAQQANADLGILSNPIVLVAIGTVGTLIVASAVAHASEHRQALARAAKGFLLS